jgi:hypothetical protein
VAILRKQLNDVTEQRDEIHRDYNCLAELLDGHDATECRMNLVRLKEDYMNLVKCNEILTQDSERWRELAISMEHQRDGLAEALEHSMKHMRHSLNCPAIIWEGLHPCNCQMDWAYDNANETLQSPSALTPSVKTRNEQESTCDLIGRDEKGGF